MHYRPINKISFFSKKHTISTDLVIILVPIFAALIICITIVIINSAFPPQIPLFYSLSWGQSQLASSGQLFILPAAIILISLINLIISWQLHQKQSLFKNILTAFSVITSIVLLICFLKIIFLFV